MAATPALAPATAAAAATRACVEHHSVGMISQGSTAEFLEPFSPYVLLL